MGMRCLATCVLVVACASAAAQAPSAPGDWPQWRGPNRDGINPESGLVKEWPEGGPMVAWQVDTVGVGYSSLAIKDGQIFTQGDLNGVEHIIALSATDGTLIWAVQPEPVAKQLEERLAAEMKRMDANSDGVVDETEALARLGWNFNKYDKPSEGDPLTPEEVGATRAAKLLKQLDANDDKQLSGAEAGQLFRDYFARIDSEDKTSDVEMLAAQRAAAYVKLLDKDSDGKVSREEARRTLLERNFRRADQRDPNTNEPDEQLTATEITADLAKHEPGKDGMLTQKELAAYYAKQYPHRDGVLTGPELLGYYGGYRNGQGDGPRGTPTVDGDRVYAEGGNGDLTCLDAKSGKTIWHVSLTRDFGGGRPGWGYCESPLIVGDVLFATPGGKQGTIVALNKKTGEQIWRSDGVTQAAHYSSPVVADIGGIRQVVQFGRSSMFGVTLDEGKLLWQYSRANNGTANVCTPIVHDNHVFASSSYGTGGGLAKIVKKDGGQHAEEVYFEKSMANHHGGIVKVGDYMYGFGSGGLICMNYLSGEIAWRARSVGKGSLVVADGMLYLLGERHDVALAEVNSEEYKEAGRFKIESHGRPSWAHPVVVGGRFYIRDQESLTAYDVSAK